MLLQSVNRSDSANDDTKAAEQRVKDLLAGRRAPSAAAAAAAGAAAGNGALTRSNAPPSRPQRTPAYFNAKVQVGGEVWCWMAHDLAVYIMANQTSRRLSPY